MVIPLLDSVVSNLKEANFLSGLLAKTGSNVFGYLVLRFSGLLKNTNYVLIFLMRVLSYLLASIS